MVVWCCGGGAPVEAYDDYGMRMFDTTPLSGHEEFWVTQTRRDYGVRMFDTTPLSGHEEFWVPCV